MLAKLQTHQGCAARRLGTGSAFVFAWWVGALGQAGRPWMRWYDVVWMEHAVARVQSNVRPINA